MTSENNIVLIAEDDESGFQVLSFTIERYTKLKPIRAKNGQEALMACRNTPGIVLVLMDIKMPLMDGKEATRLIKKEFPDLKIIATTAYALYGDEQTIRAAGCDDYLAKPIRKSVFLDMLNKHGFETRRIESGF